MMRYPFLVVLLAATIGLNAMPAGAAEPPAESVFIIVRHAEKSTDDPRDPSLSEAGLERASMLAERLAGMPLQAVYATPYRRTRQTATPTAEQHRLPVSDYDPGQPAAELAAHLRQAHPQGAVLIVGHSNTVPDIASALSGENVPAMGEDEYGLILVATPQAQEGERLHTQRF